MAKSTVPVNFKDDIMNSSMGGKRRYKMIDNSDGTISLEDATTYDQVGSKYGAAQINATNQAVNAAADAGKIIDDLDAINNVTKEGYMAGALALKQVNSNLGGYALTTIDGKIAYYKESEGADSAVPFISKKTMTPTVLKNFTTNTAWTYTINEDCYVQIICPAGADANTYMGKITINNVEIERYKVDAYQTGGWVGGYSKVYYCKKGDVITSSVVNASYAYKASLIQWN